MEIKNCYFEPSWQQRAEAAEAKLAALEKQAPVGKQYRVSAKGNSSATGWSLWHDGNGEQFRDSYDVEVREVFTRPAPAVSLAELLPTYDEIWAEAGSYGAVYSLEQKQRFLDGGKWACAAILRNIEEEK